MTDVRADAADAHGHVSIQSTVQSNAEALLAILSVSKLAAFVSGTSSKYFLLTQGSKRGEQAQMSTTECPSARLRGCLND